jgi:polypeptide N-acetylgalactosaminyltransferase
MFSRFIITFTKKFGLIFIFIGLFLYVAYFKDDNEVKVDWNDYKQLAYDALTVGFGEHGEAANITEPEFVKLNERLFDVFGMSVVVSDVISVNRSVPDYRHRE